MGLFFFVLFGISTFRTTRDGVCVFLSNGKGVDSVSVFDVLNSCHYLQFLPFSGSIFFCELMVWFKHILLSDPLCLSCSAPGDLIIDHILFDFTMHFVAVSTGGSEPVDVSFILLFGPIPSMGARSRVDNHSRI